MTANSKLGEVFTYRKQEPVNKGFGYFDPEKVFFREDENGKVIIDGKRCLIVKSKDEANVVKIGDKFYKFVQIGDQVWLAENLNYKIPGIAYNPTGEGTTEPSCWNWNNGDTEVRPKGGMYYNAFAAKYINDNNLIPGWHAAYAGELAVLNTYVGGENAKLRSLSEWPSGTVSTNEYGFNAIPAGNRNNTGVWANQTDYALITSCVIDGNNTYRLNINTNPSTTFGTVNNKNGFSLRLVKDTEPVTIGGKTYKTQKIGNQLWMTENLDYIFEGLTLGGATLQDDIHAWYYDNDTNNALLYNGFAASYLAAHPELLPEGWRVPNNEDFSTLVGNFSTGTGGKMLKTNKNSFGGINYIGFNGDPGGIIRSNGSFTDKNNYLRIWSTTVSESNLQSFLSLENTKDNAPVLTFDNDRIVGYCIRLVKDFDVSTDVRKGGGGDEPIEIKDDDYKDDEKPKEEQKK